MLLLTTRSLRRFAVSIVAVNGEVNLPNALTVLRILLVPVVLLGLLADTSNGDVIAGVAFAVAAATDWFDGYLARSRNLVTTFGKVMDPIADKLLIVGTLVTLSAIDRMSWWATGLVLAREFAVSGLRWMRKDDGVISASQYGKLKTVIQSFVLLIVIVAQPSTAVDVLIWIMVAVTLITGADYFVNTGDRLDSAQSE
jgi:CDP-diacylglycerol--glycerol-3-phosphate 3-phosphatidyltransferase